MIAARPRMVDTYHGIDILPLHVGDPIPTPRAPARYAVRVTPDLARYLLTFNHDHNRNRKAAAIQKYVGDMRDGLWRFTPESIVFSDGAVLENGQNRLMAITEYGEPVWMMVDFGWPSDIIQTIDRGAARSNQDTFKTQAIANGSNLAATIARVSHYHITVGTERGWSGLPSPSSSQVLNIYEADPASWQTSVLAGDRTYKTLDKGLTPSLWSAAHRIIGETRPDDAGAFFDEVASGAGKPGSASRALGDFYRRRPMTATRTGDRREPIENVIRAFNAHRAGKALGFATRPGFTLSRIK